MAVKCVLFKNLLHSSMFAGRLLDVCSMSARCLLDRVNGVLIY